MVPGWGTFPLVPWKRCMGCAHRIEGLCMLIAWAVHAHGLCTLIASRALCGLRTRSDSLCGVHTQVMLHVESACKQGSPIVHKACSHLAKGEEAQVVRKGRDTGGVLSLLVAQHTSDQAT